MGQACCSGDSVITKEELQLGFRPMFQDIYIPPKSSVATSRLTDR